MPGPSTIRVGRAETAADWRLARRLLGEHRRALTVLLGVDVLAGQEHADGEVDDPRAAYRAGALLLARSGGRAVGVVGVRGLGPGVAELKRMYVTPAARGLGAGRALLDAAVTTASGLGFRVLQLQTRPADMAVAHRLYRERGFLEIDGYADLGIEGVCSLALALDRRVGSAGAR
ncbi:MAG TPA: GNAT family N-acetyltransferase [Pseudonocardia sp.]|nr:GNAT family N-acetyltransferase [Pseudonocardia sp.]